MATVCLPAMAQQYSVSTAPDVAASSASVPNQINQIRLRANLPALAADPLLQHAAQLHALDMITYGNWSHIGTDGSRVKDRVARSGYVVDGWTSENWVSATDATDALRWWMNSPVHKSNILSTHWREFGIGSIVDPNSGRTIYVTVFATGKRANNPAQNNWAENNNATGQSAPPVVHAAPSVTPLGQRSNGTNHQATRATTRLTTHATIRAGDTLFGLADRLDVPWTDLASLNGWSEATILQIGEQFIIPDPLANYPTTAVAHNSNQTLPELATEKYLIQPGDTLISIATDFQSEWQVLAHINNLRNADMLQIGQNLLVPARPNSQGTTDAPAVTDVQEASVQQYPRFVPLTHVVETGDTIISIATHYGIDWQTLLQINSLTDSSILQIGQKIQISTTTN